MTPILIGLFIVLWGLTSGCVSHQHTPKQGDVQVRYVDHYVEDGKEEIQLWLYHTLDYEGMVQEVYLESGAVLVEYFNNGRFDYHRPGGDDHWRYMVIYPANVEGAMQTPSGFAHLPQNKDGTAKTTVDHGFNRWYQDRYPTTGRVVKHKRDNPTIWALRWENGKLDVTKLEKVTPSELKILHREQTKTD